MLIVLFTTIDFLLPLIVKSVGAFDVAAIFRLLRMFRAIRALRALRVLRTIRCVKITNYLTVKVRDIRHSMCCSLISLL